MLMGQALKRSLASVLSFSVSAGPLASGDKSEFKVPDGKAPPDIPNRIIPEIEALRPTDKFNDLWIGSSETFAELRSPDNLSNNPLSSLTPPPIISIFSSSSTPNEEQTSNISSPPVSSHQSPSGLNRRTARIELKNLIKNGLIDPDTGQTILGDLKGGRVSPAKIVEMAKAIQKFDNGEVGKTLSKFEIQAAVWLGYVAGNLAQTGEPPVRGPEGVRWYLRGMDERIEELLKGNPVLIDPRGREGFMEYYLSRGAPAVLRLKEDGLIDSVPRSVQLILSLPIQPWRERIRKLVETDPGKCVTAVILTLAENKIPNPLSAGVSAGDPDGNDPVSLARQLLEQFGYKSVNFEYEPLNSNGENRQVKFRIEDKEFEVTMLTKDEFKSVASKGNIPLYSVVFQTSHTSWVDSQSRPATSPDSSGFDAAIALPSLDENEHFYLWNGRRNGLLIYGEATKWVFVLTPHDHGLKHGDPIQELLIAINERNEGRKPRSSGTEVAQR